MTLFIADLRTRLSRLDIPIHYKLPEPSVLEPFFVIGNHDETDGRSALSNQIIEDTTLQIDLYLPGDLTRTEVEETRSHVRRLIGRRQGVTSNFTKDDSIGRETYHVVFLITEILV